jgi:hypothetical protein
MATPLKPNFIPGTGQLATFRSDFQAHLQGINPAGFTDFRHQANQIDLATTITINGTPVSNVQSAITTIAANLTPTIPNATTSSLGLIQLSADLGGTATAPSVIRLRGFPIATTTPVAGNFLTWNGSSWGPSNTVNGNLSVTGTTNITGSLVASNFIVPASGTLTVSNTAQLILQSGSQLQANSGSNVNINAGSLMNVASGASMQVASGGFLRMLAGSTFNTDAIFTQTSLGNLTLQSKADGAPFTTFTPWQGIVNTQGRIVQQYRGVCNTTSTSATTILTIPLPNGGTVVFGTIYIIARQLSNIDNALGITYKLLANNSSGSVSAANGTSTKQLGLSATVDPSASTPITPGIIGTNVVIQVNASTTSSVDWQAFGEVSII